ncbi:DUF3368 domain-containing protein [Persicitalea sp.]|uniref:DUF3368 domain-containing protein n=1 Tax=Persicitalea sp. TaxID=3100273 RepID=UPI003593B85C
MKNGLIISDSGPIFSLATIGKLEILDALFEKICIPDAVWKEITRDKTTKYYGELAAYFDGKVRSISGFNELEFIMDYGESEAVLLYRELSADFLLIDDKKARAIAESFGMQCVGTIGVLSIAREKGLIGELRPLFEHFLKNGRYYSLKLLNAFLKEHNEAEIE